MKKLDVNLHKGDMLQGKWNGRTYTIIRELGSGACGTVYLCKDSQGEKYALKIGGDSSRVMLEVNMLKKFSKVQGVKLGPSFVDVDDWEVRGKGVYPFYVMEYVEGKSVREFMRGRTKDWIGICALQLLTDLDHLHRAGYVFGDLKTDNLLVEKARIRWIDVGGVTPIGRAIKEYTEFYDRGYWGRGSRKADAAYDLFAVTMIMMEMVYPKRFSKGTDPVKVLESKLHAAIPLKPYRSVILGIWKGRYSSAGEVTRDLKRVLMHPGRSGSSRRRGKRMASETSEVLAFSCFVMAFFGVSIFSFWM
ncbi:protein kinase family protein [Halobacillus fulvus]|nr:protein kinase family protein [Halobacillus fulvus]